MSFKLCYLRWHLHIETVSLICWFRWQGIGHRLKKLGSTFFTFYWLALQKSPVVRVPWWNLFHLQNCTLRNISFCRYRSTDYVGQKKAMQSNNKAPRRALLFGAFVSFLMTVPAERPILCKIGKGTKLNEFTTELT